MNEGREIMRRGLHSFKYQWVQNNGIWMGFLFKSSVMLCLRHCRNGNHGQQSSRRYGIWKGQKMEMEAIPPQNDTRKWKRGMGFSHEVIEFNEAWMVIQSSWVHVVWACTTDGIWLFVPWVCRIQRTRDGWLVELIWVLYEYNEPDDGCSGGLQSIEVIVVAAMGDREQGSKDVIKWYWLRLLRKEWCCI